MMVFLNVSKLLARGCQIALVIDDQGKLEGLIADGDVGSILRDPHWRKC